MNAVTRLSKSDATVAFSFISATIITAEKLGATRQKLKYVNETHSGQNQSFSRLPVAEYFQLDSVLSDQIGAASAIRIGEKLGQQDHSMLSYLLRGCKSLKEYFETLSEYWCLMANIGNPVLEIRDDHVFFGCKFPSESAASGHSLERFVSEWLSRARHLSGVSWAPKEVYLQGPETDPAEYQRFFSAPVYNHAPGTWLVFDREILDYSIPDADPNLMRFLQPVAKKECEQLTRFKSFVQQVENVIDQLSEADFLNIETVASKLAMSVRTLQRRLSKEGVKFAEMLDTARCDRAKQALQQHDCSISEVAYSLGFSEPSTFHRAFKRWTGETPTAYRHKFIKCKLTP